MKHRFVLFLSILCSSVLYGQQGNLSLKECIQAGIRNNLSLKNARIDMMKSKTALRKAVLACCPYWRPTSRCWTI